MLTRFLPNQGILVGVFMVLLTPCIDSVSTFTELADGNSEQFTATTPALMLVQLLLLPVNLWLFMGSEVANVIEAGPFVEASLPIIALPDARVARRTVGGAIGPRSRLAGDDGVATSSDDGATLFVVIASQPRGCRTRSTRSQSSCRST